MKLFTLFYAAVLYTASGAKGGKQRPSEQSRLVAGMADANFKAMHAVVSKATATNIIKRRPNGRTELTEVLAGNRLIAREKQKKIADKYLKPADKYCAGTVFAAPVASLDTIRQFLADDRTWKFLSSHGRDFTLDYLQKLVDIEVKKEIEKNSNIGGIKLQNDKQSAEWVQKILLIADQSRMAAGSNKTIVPIRNRLEASVYLRRGDMRIITKWLTDLTKGVHDVLRSKDGAYTLENITNILGWKTIIQNGQPFYYKENAQDAQDEHPVIYGFKRNQAKIVKGILYVLGSPYCLKQRQLFRTELKGL